MKTNYTINFTLRGFLTVFLPLLVVLGGVSFVAGFLLIDRVVMPRMVGVTNRGTIIVPQLAELSYDQAREKLYANGLRASVRESRYDSAIPGNYVISQQPQAGEKVKNDRLVTLVVSKGPEADTVPVIEKMTEIQARNALRRRGFGRIRITRSYDEDVARDLVVKSIPAWRTVMSREAPVEVVISRGPRPTHATVPSLIGDMLSEARQKVEECGLVIGSIEYRYGTSSPAGSVISQSATPGTAIPLEAKIDLTVAATR